MGWRAPAGPLGRLSEAAGRRADALKAERRRFEVEAARRQPKGRFLQALQAGGASGRVQVIAELKRRSPSKGVLAPGLDALLRAQHYVAGGACALSVLTEPEEFGGSTDDLLRLDGQVEVPLLKKDFHVDEIQLLEGAASGAAAALLIARALPPKRLRELAEFAFALGLEPLVEVRSLGELECAIDAGARVIGVNARDLETLVIDAGVVDRLIPAIPAHCVAVAESGIETRADVARVAGAGADAVLVGSMLSRSADGIAAVRDLAGVERVARG